ncbi:MAG: prepilin-type N-terminal cleavage/methylation domain-containing protein [Oceanicoccus sp.]|jgi:prepilin-type N-terminal cleavage/methylation domain-containing protein
MKKQIGMTLIELMVATAIFIAIVSWAMPSMKFLIDRKNLQVIGPTFERSIRLARTEAIQRSQTVRISPLSGSSDWSKGWRIDAITNPNQLNENLELIRTFDSLSGDPNFSSNIFDGDTKFEIRSDGQASLVGDFTIHLANCEGGKKYIYSVLLSGLLSRNETTCP